MQTKERDRLHSLIPLAEFKTVLGIDDREDKLARFCLVTATHTIEQHCMRRLLRKKHFETIEFTEDLFLPLRDYPVTELLAAYALAPAVEPDGKFLEPDFYKVIPDLGCGEDMPYTLVLSPALLRYRGLVAIKAVYQAGYVVNPHPCGFTTRSFCEAKTPAKALKTAASMPQVPPDLASACLELASWNMNRYKGRRIGMTGNVRGSGRDGEHFEMSMPENVRALLEAYRRRTI